jgi:hypothetical protein
MGGPSGRGRLVRGHDTPATRRRRVDARRKRRGGWYHGASFITISAQPMELNLIRQRIADLKGRLDSLRGYL